jgi:acyl-CoA thioesterase FadM
MGKQFIYNHLVYLNETNAMGGVVYYSNYSKWQGIVREAFFIRCVPEWQQILAEVLKGNVGMITVEEYSSFIHHAYFGDEIVIKAVAKDIQKFNFKIAYEMTKEGQQEIIYQGWQKIAFSDNKGKFIPIPEPFLKAALEHASSGEVEQYKARYLKSGDKVIQNLLS